MMRTLLIAPITLYQWFISPLLGVRCRYEPSCAHYARQAVAMHGIKGVVLSIRRILRCQPFGGSGYDPVPTNHKE